MNLVKAASFLFVLFLALGDWGAKTANAEAANAEAVNAEAANAEVAWRDDWLQISTQNAGTLSLPRGWDVVSKDDPTERSPDAERMFHVQLALYARYGETSADTRGTLQVFSIWNADRVGKTLPLPPHVLDETGGDFAAGLIGARYGNVEQVGEDLVPTALEDLVVAAYEADFSRPASTPTSTTTSKDLNRRFRYRCASLFYGDKLVLVLVKYLPDGEGFWRRHFETLLGTWVASLTLTPRPLEMAADRVPLPEAIRLPEAEPLPEPAVTSLEVTPLEAAPLSETDSARPQEQPPFAVVSPDAVVSDNVAPAPATHEREPSFVLYGGSALAALVVLLACVGKIFAWRRKKRGEQSLDLELVLDELGDLRDLPDEKPDENEGPVPEEPIETTPVMEEGSMEERLVEENLMKESLVKESLIEEGSSEAILIGESRENSWLESADRRDDDEENDDEDRSDEASPEEGDDESVDERAGEETRPFAKELGFDKVYDLLNRALTDLDTQPAPEPRSSRHYVSRNAMPNLPETIEVLDGLDAMFGESFVMETLKGEVLKALELKEGTPTLPTKDATRECFVLRLCCGALVNMLRSGRYHIGKGILNSEGEGLVNLFERINGLRAQKGCSTPEEAGRDSAFMRFSVRESGGGL
jgi:hypothetical protein